MRIDLNPALPLTEGDSTRTKSSRSLASDESPAEREVATGSNPKSVRSFAETPLSAPDARMDKVEALRNGIAAGTYEVSSRQIATAIFEQLVTRG